MAAKILLVDDDLAVLNPIKAWLQAAGYEVLTASDGEEGWAVFAQYAPGAVISGLRMPNLDGLGLLKRIRSRAPALPVILIAEANERDSSEESEMKSMAVTAYLELPLHDASDLTRWLGAV